MSAASAILQNAVGGLIASEAHGIIALVLSRINEEIKLAWGFKSELEELQKQLTQLSWLLEGASVQPNTNPLMVDWLNKIKDAANDADDLLDKWSYEVLKRRIETRKRDKLKHCVSDPICRLKMAHKVRDMRKLIGSIYNDAKELGIKPIKVAAGDVYNGRGSSLRTDQERKLQDQRQWVDQECFRGREDSITRLVAMIREASMRDVNLSVIGIVGMPGLGKTTLCKRVVKGNEVMECFEVKVIWLVVSHNYNLNDILKRMLEKLFDNASNMKDNQAIVEKLQEKLKGKRYLLILDDVWNTVDWESLRGVLLEIGGSKGTCLIVTSRERNVVAKMDTYNYDGDGKLTIKSPTIYQLRELNDDDSWSLFMMRMGVKDKDLGSNEKKLMARRMIEKCRGVPLAIRALGDLLRDKDIGRWQEIEKSNIWMENDEYGILPSLKLSFNYLPNMALKKCFSYCAIFKEDEVIEKNQLICMWMAQGFLHPYDKMELVGEEYFEYLLNCSFFQDVVMDKLGNVKTFQMHDLVLALACVVSREDSTMCKNLNPISCKKLRTYLHARFNENLDFVSNCRRLRVLSIGNIQLMKLGSPGSLLKHLRYLVVTYEMFQKFSEKISKLYHLQTLQIELGHLIPERIGHLVNLRHIICDDDIGIPEGLSNLSSLRTLPAINLRCYWGGRLSELGPLQNLRGTLEIRNLECVKDEEEAQSLILGNKSNVQELVLSWRHKSVSKWDTKLETSYRHKESQNGILEALQPHANLAMLRVAKYMGSRFPRWLIGRDSPLHNLVSLTLRRCTYAEGFLNMENFKSLRFLDVWSCYELTISFPIDGFECCKFLEEMRVIICCKVENLPDLSSFTELRILKIYENKIDNRSELVGLASHPCLRELRADGFVLPADLGKDSPVCKSLENLTLWPCEEDEDAESLPVELQHLVGLQELNIGGFQSLEILPDWLGNLTSLRCLNLYDMPNLKRLPSQDAMQSLSNLQTFTSNNCPLLNEDLMNPGGKRFKIAHIPNITIDYEKIK